MFVYFLLLLLDHTLGQSCGADLISYNGQCVNNDCKSNLENQILAIQRGLNATYNIQQNNVTGTINISNLTLFDDPKTCMGFFLFFADPQTYQRVGTKQVNSDGVDGVVPLSPQSSYSHIDNSAYISFLFNNSDVQQYCKWISSKDYKCTFQLSAALAGITQRSILFDANITLLGICDLSSTKLLYNQCVPLQCFDKIKSVNQLKSSNQFNFTQQSVDNTTYQIQMMYSDGQTGWILDDSITNCVQAQVVFMTDTTFQKPQSVQYDSTNPDGYYPTLPILQFQRQTLKQIISFDLSMSDITKFCQNKNGQYQCFFALGFKLVNQTQATVTFSMVLGISKIICTATQTLYQDVCVDQTCFTTQLTNLMNLIQQQLNNISTSKNQTDQTYLTQIAYTDGLNGSWILDQQFCLNISIFSQNSNYSQRQAFIQTTQGMVSIWPSVTLVKQGNQQIIQFTTTLQNLISYCTPLDSSSETYDCFFEMAFTIQGILQKSIWFKVRISVNVQCPQNQIFYYKGCIMQSCLTRVQTLKMEMKNILFKVALNKLGSIDGNIQIPTQTPYFNDPVNCLNYSIYFTNNQSISPPPIVLGVSGSYDFSNNVESLFIQITAQDIIKNCYQEKDQNQKICYLPLAFNIYEHFQDYILLTLTVNFDAQSSIVNVDIGKIISTQPNNTTLNISINTSALVCGLNIWPCPQLGNIFVVGDPIFVRYFITDKNYNSFYLNQIEIMASSTVSKAKLNPQLIQQKPGYSILQTSYGLTVSNLILTVQGIIGESPMRRILALSNDTLAKNTKVSLRIYQKLNSTLKFSTINNIKQLKLPNFVKKNTILFLFWYLTDPKYSKNIIVSPQLIDSKGKLTKINCISGVNKTSITGCSIKVSTVMSKKQFTIIGSIKNNKSLIVKKKFSFPLIK